MASAPHMKARLEAAIKGNQELLNAKATPTRLPDKRQVPSIKLKTNFLWNQGIIVNFNEFSAGLELF